MNVEAAKAILQNLQALGVQTLCVCPGARNAPFIELLSKTSSFEVISFFDERAAGFFALGRARRDQQPVAVLTTSGTAVSELLSPMVEAFYTQTPLIVVSSDRPKRLRGTGAPQAIEQKDLFANYVEKSWDLSASEVWEVEDHCKGPWHLNICFDEPLLDSSSLSFDGTIGKSFVEKKPLVAGFNEAIRLERALVVVGALRTEHRLVVQEFLQKYNIPIFLEASSQLRGSEWAKDKTLLGGEKLVAKLIKSGAVKNILRLGDIPLGRYWRDLDRLDLDIYSLSEKPWKGLENSKMTVGELKEESFESLQLTDWDFTDWLSEGQTKQIQIQELLQSFPRSEARFFSELSQTLPNNETLYLGNSLPVRLWDLVCAQGTSVRTNRGANGIDGQISTALGWMEPDCTHWVVVGDLTALYDMNGLWVSSYLKEKKINVNLVVVNNGGGQIFNRIFDNSLFLNSHDLNFEYLAKFWGWNYKSLQEFEHFPKQEGLNLYEWQPCPQQTQEFWERYDQLWVAKS